MDVLYERIRDLREKRGLSQDELARRTGYTSRSSIAKIETGKVDVGLSKVKIFAEALNTTPSYLLGWDWDVVDMTLNSMEACAAAAYREKLDRQHIVNQILGVWDNPHPKDEKVSSSLLKLNQIYLALDENGRKAVDFMINYEYQDENTIPALVNLTQKYLELEPEGRAVVDFMVNNEYNRRTTPINDTKQ